MWTRLLATGFIPLLILALLNSRIYISIRKSKQRLRSLAIRSALPMAILGAKSAAAATTANVAENLKMDALGQTDGGTESPEPRFVHRSMSAMDANRQIRRSFQFKAGNGNLVAILLCRDRRKRQLCCAGIRQ